MRVRGVATFAAVAAAALAAGCGEDDFENEPRPPVPMELSGVIQDDRLTVSPSRNIGAGPFTILISNQTDAEHTVTLEGESVTEEVGPVQPDDTVEIKRTLAPGSYEVRAGSARAVRREIQPAMLDIGAERENSNSELLL
ncbi:MAG TPA: hypothetical protein VGW14_10390, partial [Thermoleophilaceae bacterium]|nr:hypothetical protein [Thermoleophilaceae bacterium]